MSSISRWCSRTVLVLSAVLLLSAAFPPLGISWAAWLALVPLALVVTECASVCTAFAPGFAAGTLWLLLVLDWIRTISAEPSDINGPLWPAWLALGIVVGGLTVGLSTTILWFVVHRFRWPFTLAMPVVWIVGESFRDVLSWTLFATSGEVMSLAITQANQRIVLQLAELGGVSAIAWTVAVSNGFLVDLIQWPRQSVRFCRMGVRLTGACLVIVAAGLVFGMWRARQTVEMSIPVCAVPMKMTPDRVLAAMPYAARATVVVWPEHALDELQAFETGDVATGIVTDAARTLNRPQIVGCDRLSRQPLALYNSAIVVAPDGHLAGVGDKRFLAPLERLTLFGRMLDPSGVFTRTKYSAAHQSGVADLPTGHQVGLGVCHDVCFAAWGHDLRSRFDPDFLVCCSNTQFDPSGRGSMFVLALTQLRAVESRRSIVTCAINGPITVVDGSGDVTSRIQNGIVVVPVPLDRRTNMSIALGTAWIAVIVVGVGCTVLGCPKYRLC